MNGTRFVALLVVVAIAAVALIVLGVPKWGATGVVSDTGSAGMTPTGDLPAAGPSAGPGPGSSPPPTATAVDSGSTMSADTAAAWAYRRTAVADLDADGVPERVVVASDVFVTADGEPLWADVHRWAVYVEEDDGARTLVYSAFAPSAGVSVAVAGPTEGGRRSIVVIEQGPRRGRLLVAAYAGAGRARLIDGAGEHVELWVERVAEETE